MRENVEFCGAEGPNTKNPNALMQCIRVRTGSLELNRIMTTGNVEQVPGLCRSFALGALFAGLSLVPAIGGCSVVVDADRPQCSKDADCVQRGAAFADSICSAGICRANPNAAQWECPAGPSNMNPAYKLTLHLTDAVLQKQLPGVTAQLCRKLDISCSSPSNTTVSDATGTLSMQVEAGFDGYLTLSGNMLVPELYAIAPPRTGDLEATTSLLSPTAVSGLTQAAGGTWLMDHGLVLLDATDCAGGKLANVSFSVAGGAKDSSTYVFYTVKSFPTMGAVGTDESGYGGVINLLPGVATISANLSAKGGGTRQVGNVSLNVRAGYISFSNVSPSSLPP